MLMAEKLKPEKKFIDEIIIVFFNQPPVFTKKPPCPDGFIWREQKYVIENILLAWNDFSRHGSYENNMSLEHSARASLKGSWGVGRYYFQFDTREGRRFEIYYDRSPEKSDDRNGHWFLLYEYIH
jgi:hypothetical protein